MDENTGSGAAHDAMIRVEENPKDEDTEDTDQSGTEDEEE